MTNVTLLLRTNHPPCNFVFHLAQRFHDVFFSSNRSWNPSGIRPFSGTTVSFGTALASCEGDGWPKAFLLWEKLRSNTLQVSQAKIGEERPKKHPANLCAVTFLDEHALVHGTMPRKLGDELRMSKFYIVDRIWSVRYSQYLPVDM